jgi:hypothetical protein
MHVAYRDVYAYVGAFVMYHEGGGAMAFDVPGYARIGIVIVRCVGHAPHLHVWVSMKPMTSRNTTHATMNGCISQGDGDTCDRMRDAHREARRVPIRWVAYHV